MGVTLFLCLGTLSGQRDWKYEIHSTNKKTAILIIILAVAIGCFLPPKSDWSNELNFSSQWWEILLGNSIIITLWLLLSFIGVFRINCHFCFLSHIPGLLIGASIHYDAPINKILISGIPHGIGEAILTYFVCVVSINWLQLF